MHFPEFLQSHQLQLDSIPKHLWKSIHRKLCWDSEPSELELLKSDPDQHQVTLESSTSILDPDGQVFVLDHIFTFSDGDLRESLDTAPKSDVDAMALVLSRRGMDVATTSKLASAIWTIADAYTISVTKEQGKVTQQFMWYVPGEKILNMAHSDTPNMNCCLFFDMYGMRPINLIWPNRIIKSGEPLTRDYLQSCKNKKERQSLAFAWFHLSEPPASSLSEKIKASTQQVDTKSDNLALDVKALQIDSKTKTVDYTRKILPKKEKYLVYSPDIAKHLFKDSLRGSKFELTTSTADADIFWTAEKHHYNSLGHHQFYNNFPNQGTLVVKDRLQACIYKHWGLLGSEKWYPRSFNLNWEVDEFVSMFLACQSQNSKNNVWIVKPWNGTRSQGIIVSRDLPEILKQLATGPKLVAKYIHPPALLEGKTKFDLRVLVIIESVSPLKLYTVPTAIYSRESNVPYDIHLEQLDSFTHHFTVMGYRQLDVVKSPLPELKTRIEACSAKPISFDKDILPRILQVIRNGVEAAVNGDGLESLGADVKVKSMYGADVILDADLNPWLLEFSEVPDTGRVIETWPTLYGDLLNSLFVADQMSEKFVAF
ncbi:hypothetical protein MT418_003054 [Batrachochytrium dendrobatidis]